MYDDSYDILDDWLSEGEQDLLDSVLRMFPGEGDALAKLDRYIGYEAKRVHDSSDGKWHREFLAELEALRSKLRSVSDKQAHADVDWALVERLLTKEG